MNKKYTYKNNVAGNTVMPVPAVTFDNVLYLDREGIGIRLLNLFGTGDIEADVYSFYRMSKKVLGVVDPARFFQRSLSIVGGTYIRKFTFQGLGFASTSIIYYIKWMGVGARYTPQDGDDAEGVYAGIAGAVNSAIYPTGYTATATATATDVTISTNSAAILNSFVLYLDNYKFESGYYAQLNILGQTGNYLINKSESNTDYPPLPTLAASYDFNLLDLIENGIEDYLRHSEFPIFALPLELSTSNLGTVTVSGAPYIVENSSRAVLDEPNSRIIFSHKTPLKKNEIVNLLYK